jgi:hypothetical protein
LRQSIAPIDGFLPAHGRQRFEEKAAKLLGNDSLVTRVQSGGFDAEAVL